MRSGTASWRFTKEELMKPVKPGGTSFSRANEIRKEVFAYLKKIAKKLNL